MAHLSSATSESPPPLSAASSDDDDQSFFSALSLNVSRPLSHVLIDSDDMNLVFLPEDETSPYARSIQCPLPQYSGISGQSFVHHTRSSTNLPEHCSSEPEEAAQTIQPCTESLALEESLQTYPEVTVNLLSQKKPQQHQRSESLPDPLKQRIYRHNQPTFVKFPDSLPLNKSQLHGLRSPHPRCISNSIGTEALISLAWTGEISSLIAVSNYAPSSIGSTYMWPKLKISEARVDVTHRRTSWPGWLTGQRNLCEVKNDPKFRHHLDSIQTITSHSRCHCWSLASVISDDRVPDEELVELLEELRFQGLRSTQRSTSRFLPDPPTPTDEVPICNIQEPPDGDECALQSLGNIISDDISKSWYTARRALLACRELIHTERHYLMFLDILVKSETQTPPPLLMTDLLPPLIHASSFLLSMMEANPSVLGVSSAFVQASERLEAALVSWCEVAGEFFTTYDSEVPRKRPNSSSGGPSAFTGLSSPAMLTKRVGSWGRKKQPKGLFGLDDTTSRTTQTEKSKARHKPSVRDLAILPTQRITRYVLLFKVLLAHTGPSTDIRATVERANEAAMTLARKANKVQNHVAFRIDPLAQPC